MVEYNKFESEEGWNYADNSHSDFLSEADNVAYKNISQNYRKAMKKMKDPYLKKKGKKGLEKHLLKLAIEARTLNSGIVELTEPEIYLN
ncbi:hypothetical protein ACFLZZ_00235 [Nanoarchaeota archaeon]